MKPNPNRSKVILALKQVIEATFDEDKWRKLGYLTDSIDIIEGHSRLLTSLRFRGLDVSNDNYMKNCMEGLQGFPETLHL